MRETTITCDYCEKQVTEDKSSEVKVYLAIREKFLGVDNHVVSFELCDTCFKVTGYKPKKEYKVLFKQLIEKIFAKKKKV